MNTVLWMLALVAGLLLVWRWLQARAGSQRATPMAVDEPWLQAAVLRARSSYDEMQGLVRDGQQVAVKFPLINAKGETEHVWGGVTDVDDDGANVFILTQLLAGATPEGPMRVTRAELEDWQVFLEDGSIRGGFTTQAQLAVCLRENLPIPRSLREQRLRFLDRIDFPPLKKTS